MNKIYVHSYIQIRKHKPGERYDDKTKKFVVNLVREIGSYIKVAQLTGISVDAVSKCVKKWV